MSNNFTADSVTKELVERNIKQAKSVKNCYHTHSENAVVCICKWCEAKRSVEVAK